MRDYNFGEFIFKLRKQKKLTQSQLGEKLGVSDKAVSKWENGAAKPSVDMLYKLAEFFNVSVDELVSGKLVEDKKSQIIIKEKVLKKKKPTMKILISLAVAVVLLVTTFFVFFSNRPRANVQGNTNSNLVRWGLVATQGEWVYYQNAEYNNYLYKMRSDGTEKQILSKDYAIQINVVGDWVYYVKEHSYVGNDGGIYKIKTDGTKRTRLSNTIPYWLLVLNGEIYYVTQFEGGPINKMTLDGEYLTTICNDVCRDVNFIDNNFYYINDSDNLIYKISIDGTGRKVFNSTLEAYNLVGEGDYLFVEDTDEICRMSTTDDECLYYKNYKNFQSSFLNYYDGWIYFIGHNFADENNIETAIYKMKSNTQEITKLLDIEFSNMSNYSISVADGWIYFNNESDNNYMYRIKTDGSNLQKIYV